MTHPNSELSEIHVSCVDDVLRIHYDRARPNPNDHFEIALDDIPDTTRKKSPVQVKSNYLKNRIFLVEKANRGETVVVYTNNDSVMYYKHDNALTHPLSRLLDVQTKATRIKQGTKACLPMPDRQQIRHPDHRD